MPVLSDLAACLPEAEVVYVEYHSESDRLELDALLKTTHKLWRAAAEDVHRGNLAYLSRALLSRAPRLERKELRRSVG